MVDRGELTESAWATIEPLLPAHGRRGGQCRASDRARSDPLARSTRPDADWRGDTLAMAAAAGAAGHPWASGAARWAGSAAPGPSRSPSGSLWGGADTPSGGVWYQPAPAAAVRWPSPPWRRPSGTAPARSGGAEWAAHPRSPARAPRAEPASLCVCLGMEGKQIRPQASGRGAQRLALNQGGRGETTQGDESHDAGGDRLLVGHALSSPQHRSTQHTR